MEPTLFCQVPEDRALIEVLIQDPEIKAHIMENKVFSLMLDQKALDILGLDNDRGLPIRGTGQNQLRDYPVEINQGCLCVYRERNLWSGLQLLT